MREKLSRTAKLSTYINEWVNRLPWGKRLYEQLPVLYWRNVCGEEIYSRTKPLRVENSILYVEVKDLLWRRELMMHEKEFLKRYERIGFKLKGIRFIGRL